jgi:hypothetical protein
LGRTAVIKLRIGFSFPPENERLLSALNAVLYLLISESKSLLNRNKDAKPIINFQTAVFVLQVYADRNIISQNIKNIAADNQTINNKQ